MFIVRHYITLQQISYHVTIQDTGLEMTIHRLGCNATETGESQLMFQR
jgi:hypothetical protein